LSNLLALENLVAVKQHESVVGFWGAPPRRLLEQSSQKYNAPLLDLDVHYGFDESKIVPETYCHIIRNCVDNAIALGKKLVCLVAATGPEKCDAGRYAAWLVREHTSAEVIFSVNEGEEQPLPALLCEAHGPLKERVVRTMRTIVNPLNGADQTSAIDAKSRPTHGFWGTPPHPIGLLDLFPETTHIFGWTRCVEQGRPADLNLEMQVPDDLPIVFFSQGFCHKAQLARHLAHKYRGMHVDVHDSIGAATHAKIEAFIRLSTTGSMP
jgi:hypothetical protein